MSAIAPYVNTFGEVADYILRRTAQSLAPTVLGATGAWLVGLNPLVGAAQGLLHSSLCSHVIIPIADYVHKNAGNGPNQFHKKARNILKMCGLIVEIAVPILVTSYCAEKILPQAETLSPYLSFLVTPSISEKPLTMLKGLMICLAPISAQLWLEEWNEKARRDASRR